MLMLVPNADIWQTRIQNVDTLLTASAGGRHEVYYLATVCQVALDPPLVSVSPNPEYPICAAIEAGGRFGLCALAAGQGELVARCMAVNRDEPDKLSALGLAHERAEHGTPLLLDCIEALECVVERAWDSGDHRTFIGRVIERRIRPGWSEQPPHRFGGRASPLRRAVKQLLCRSRLLDVIALARGWLRPAVSLEEGTRRMLDPTTTPASRTRRAPAPPGVCLVGCGWWGRVHGLALKQLGPTVRRFFASRNLEHARDFARKFDGDSVSGLAEALANPRIDAVILALPHHLHAETARAALDAGKHVLVEKPLALTIDEGQDLVRQADAANLCLAVAEEYRHSPLIQRAGEVLASGELGTISLIQAGSVASYRPEQDWKNQRDTMGGGVLLDVGIHYIDILRHWFGAPDLVLAGAPGQVNTQLGGEDGAAVLLRFPTGPLAQLHISWSAVAPAGRPNVEILGERGALQIWFDRPYLLLTTPLPAGHWSHKLGRVLPWRLRRHLTRFLPQVRRRRLCVPRGDLIGSRALLEDFIHAITTGAEPRVTGRDGLEDLRIVHAAYQALRTG
jgi:predicted dehydrogenase/flavin reductase (DIM6/NTAB) family NADH-FMN oxidoreductase RutF